jgi:hypothetical protein
MHNAPGTVVTMMNPRHVRHVFVAGKAVYWGGALVGWDVEALLRRLDAARDRVLARITGPAKVGALPRGNNSESPYRPAFLTSCCERGQNDHASPYRLRP